MIVECVFEDKIVYIDFLVGGVITKDTMEDDGQMNHCIDVIERK